MKKHKTSVKENTTQATQPQREILNIIGSTISQVGVVSNFYYHRNVEDCIYTLETKLSKFPLSDGDIKKIRQAFVYIVNVVQDNRIAEEEESSPVMKHAFKEKY